jgi:CubicO group peptidase (beta-lactamase class C family)
MKTVSCWILIGLLLPFFALAQDAKKEAPLTPSAKMDKLFDFWNRLNQPGFAVAVVQEGRVVYQNVFGLACQEHTVPITPMTVFNTATAAQPVVGMAVALLEKQGKLTLEDDVRKTIPEIPDFGTPLKLRHLLYQTSGLRDWFAVLQLGGRDKEEVTFKQVLQLVKAQKKLAFPPGERVQYSNTNYDLLAEVIRRITGRPFPDWAWENIFKPLKMTRSQLRENCRSLIDDQAFSYNYTRVEYLKGMDNLSLSGSHSLFAPIADLAKWLLNLETGQIGGKDVFAKMFTAGRLNNGQSSGFGYGVKVDSRPSGIQVSQIGTWAGSGAALVYYPDRKFGFFVLANWDYTPVEGFVQQIIDIYLPAPAAARPEKKSMAAVAKKAVKLSPEKLDSYIGDYRLAPGQVFAISRSGSQLIFNFPGAKFPLVTLAENEFLLAIADARLIFQKDKQGEVRRLLWKQDGDEQIVPKVVMVKPNPQELLEFAGTYGNEELNLRYAVELRGDTLAVVVPGQNEIRLAPDEKDHFTTGWRAFPMVIFQRDGNGRLNGFMIDSDAVRDLVFKKEEE